MFDGEQPITATDPRLGVRASTQVLLQPEVARSLDILTVALSGPEEAAAQRIRRRTRSAATALEDLEAASRVVAAAAGELRARGLRTPAREAYALRRELVGILSKLRGASGDEEVGDLRCDRRRHVRAVYGALCCRRVGGALDRLVEGLAKRSRAGSRESPPPAELLGAASVDVRHAAAWLLARRFRPSRLVAGLAVVATDLARVVAEVDHDRG